MLVVAGIGDGSCVGGAIAGDLPYSNIAPRIIAMDLPAAPELAGGLVTADLDGDGARDFLVTRIGHVAAYSGRGRKLWIARIDLQVTGHSNKEGLPGLHAPGVQAADIDGDGRLEVLFLDRSSALHVLDGATGKTLHRVAIEPPAGAVRWEHLVVANFRGRGDRDLLLQTTSGDKYRFGRHVAAYALDELTAGGAAEPLWSRDDVLAPAHNGVRVTDLDGDGRDEVVGGTVLGPDGRVLLTLPVDRNPFTAHVDSVFIHDVRPDLPGLEVVALEERGGNHIFLYNRDRILWQTHYRHQEPQNAAIGEFDPDRPGLEIWCRSRYNVDQKPFVFDSRGTLIAGYEMKDHAPPGWTAEGVEVIAPIHWTGGPVQLAAAKERHEAGDVGIFDPVSGRFLHRFREKAERIYVADVSGDWREEIIVLNGNALHIYENDAPNPDPDRKRLWETPSYARSKMTWNYYSP